MQLRRLGQNFNQWKRLLDDRQVNIPLNPVVVGSWRRSRAANVDPESKDLPLGRVSESELRRLLAAYEDLITAASGHCEWLSKIRRGMPHAACIASASGVVLYAVGNDSEMLDGLGLVPGCDWSESRIGSNGVGTAIHLNRPVALVGLEHFHQRLAHYATYGVPIRLSSRHIAACIGLCCKIEDSQPDHLMFLTHIAAIVQQQAAYVREIKKHTRTEEHMERARMSAEAASSAKSDLLARISHDLRIPLTAIIGFCHILQERYESLEESQRRTFLERIQTNAVYQLKLIDEILDFARSDSGNIELQIRAVRLDALVREVVDTIAGGIARPNVFVKLQMPDHLGEIEADYGKLKQVLTNIVHNALKYTTEGDVIVRVSADPDGRPIRVEVIDRGPGIPRAALGRIFEPFKRAGGDSRAGTGLGLAISRSLCAAMGFELSVQSAVGRGSVFAIQLRPTLHAVQTGTCQA